MAYIERHAPRPPARPRLPRTFQTLGWWTGGALFERCRARCSNRFTTLFLQTPPFVHLLPIPRSSEVFTAPPEVLPQPGAPASRARGGQQLRDPARRRRARGPRKLMRAAFTEEKMERLTGVVAEVAEREVASWPRDEPLRLHPRLQA